MSIAATRTAQRWRCLECGDTGWAADRADVEEHLARVGVELGDLAPSSIDYCPECYWELVTGSEPTLDVLPPMIIGRTLDVDSVPAHRHELDDDAPSTSDNWPRRSLRPR